MSQLPGARTQCLAVLVGLTQLSLLLACSATVPSSRKYVGPSLGPEGSADSEESFPDLWEKRTVYPGMARHSAVASGASIPTPQMMSGPRP